MNFLKKTLNLNFIMWMAILGTTCFHATAQAQTMDSNTQVVLKNLYATLSEIPGTSTAQLNSYLEGYINLLQVDGKISAATAESYISQLPNLIANDFPGADPEELQEIETAMQTFMENPAGPNAVVAITAVVVKYNLQIFAQVTSDWLAEVIAISLPGISLGLAADEFLGFAYMLDADQNQMNAITQAYYAQCLATSGCAAAMLAGDWKSVGTLPYGGTFDSYYQGTYIDLGKGQTGDVYAWQDKTLVPGFYYYRFPNGTVCLVSNDGQTIIGTTKDGNTYTAKLIPNSGGQWTVSYSNGGISLGNQKSLLPGTKPGTAPGGPNGGTQNPGPYDAPPSVSNTALGNITVGGTASVSACWYDTNGKANCF